MLFFEPPRTLGGGYSLFSGTAFTTIMRFILYITIQ